MKRSFDPLVLCLLALSLCGNVYLYRNHDPHPPIGAVKFLEPGDRVPEFRATAADGSFSDIAFTSRPTVLYVFSPRCSWCARNLANARALADQAAERYRFVSIALDDTGLDDYLARNHLEWQVLKRLPDSVLTAYRLAVTPETVVVGSDGLVLHVWVGAYQAKLAEEIQSALGVQLPGLLTVNPEASVH